MPEQLAADETTRARELEVTVVIPTRNRRCFLEQSVGDVLRQVGVELELVVVDDGSTDDDAVDGIERLDPRIRIVRHATRRGVACARNSGVAAARGAWVAFLDDDDRWAPTKLRVQLDAAAEQQASWVYAAALTIDAKSRVLAATMPPASRELTDWMLDVNPVPGGCSNVIARTELIREVGGFDEDLALIADWDLWIRLAKAATPATCRDLVVAYRLHPDNMHVLHSEAAKAELDHFAEKYRGREPSRPIHPDLLGWHANAHRRAGHRGRAARLYLQRWRATRDFRDLVRVLLSLLGERFVGVVRERWVRRHLARLDWLAEDADRTATTPTGEPCSQPGVAG